MNLVLLRLKKVTNAWLGKFMLFCGDNKVFECATSEPLFEHTSSPEGNYSLAIDWDDTYGKHIIATQADTTIKIAIPKKRPDIASRYIHVVRRSASLHGDEVLYETACDTTMSALIAAITPAEKCSLTIITIGNK